MSEKNVPTESVRSATERGVSTDLIGAALSATCRMVVPVFTLFGTGLLVDYYLSQKAFYAIIGAITGFIIAGLLIYLQLKSYNKKKQACCEAPTAKTETKTGKPASTETRESE